MYMHVENNTPYSPISGLLQSLRICLLLDKPYSMKLGTLKPQKTLNLLGIRCISKANYNWELLK